MDRRLVGVAVARPLDVLAEPDALETAADRRALTAEAVSRAWEDRPDAAPAEKHFVAVGRMCVHNEYNI
ncbi:hypothetical protein KDAU_16660 [Dictyobacter aurantiacus]|uniref:Uncharacterized protein n=1 Tax=Dictyobacter aurantiacus TaxID=1936993 RepID=A0A401ZBT5_9CHLR|nr:hypothetical protein KDAU_16660 [Dictyobacter aurantiacus]